MYKHYYRHVDLQDALAWVGVDGCAVWYYTGERDLDPPPWTDKVKPREGAKSAIVMTSKPIDVGTEIGMVDDKDPIPDPPPPPPPAFFSDLRAYLAQRSVVHYFRPGGRGIEL